MLRQHAMFAAVIGALAFAAPAFSATAGDGGTGSTTKAQKAAKEGAGVEAHIAQLHKKLKITEQQAPQWNAFAQVMRDNNEQIGKLAQSRMAQLKDLNAVDDLRSFQEIAQAHADGLKRLQTAFQAVYDTMTPEQRKNADSVFHEDKQRMLRKGGA